MFMRPAPEGSILTERHGWPEAALVVSSVAVIVLGVLPNLISGWLNQAGTVFGQ
jgi:NADH-quinone oxidoreductase subunit N